MGWAWGDLVIEFYECSRTPQDQRGQTKIPWSCKSDKKQLNIFNFIKHFIKNSSFPPK